jgi:hypothetical protein
MRHRTFAVICVHLAEYAADAFRGNDAKPPTKLLRLPNGTNGRAEMQDVIEVEEMLRQLAFMARSKAERLRSAHVVVEQAALHHDVPRGPAPPAPEDETVLDTASLRKPKPSGATKSG